MLIRSSRRHQKKLEKKREKSEYLTTTSREMCAVKDPEFEGESGWMSLVSEKSTHGSLIFAVRKGGKAVISSSIIFFSSTSFFD